MLGLEKHGRIYGLAMGLTKKHHPTTHSNISSPVQQLHFFPIFLSLVHPSIDAQIWISCLPFHPIILNPKKQHTNRNNAILKHHGPPHGPCACHTPRRSHTHI